MSSRFLVSILSCLMCLLGAAAPLSAEPGDPVPPELSRFVEEVDSLSGRFVQTQTDEYGELILSGEGQVLIERPGRFRWAYETPYEQLMVCDGQTIWAYDKDLAQVTVRPAGEALAGTPAELLARNARLGDNYRIEVLPREAGLERVRLTPRAAESDFKTIELLLDGGVPRRLSFSDPLGGRTEVDLLDLKVNEPLDARQFEFSPPPGTEVVQAEPAP